MKLNYLFPSKYKKIGWFIFIPTLLFGLFTIIFDFEPEFLDVKTFSFFSDDLFKQDVYFGLIKNNILNEILGVLMVIGSVLVAFSKEVDEDEYISKIRLESLVWAVYLNYAILLVAIVFVFGFSFLWVMIFNMFTILIFFIIRFNWQIRKMRIKG